MRPATNINIIISITKNSFYLVNKLKFSKEIYTSLIKASFYILIYSKGAKYVNGQ